MKRLLLPLLLLCVVAVAGCDNNLVSTGDKGYVSGNGDVTIVPAEDRELPEPIGGSTLDGKQATLDDYRGKVVVMPVWASWCGPCRSEAAMFEAASKDLAAQDVAFLGLNVRDSNAGDRDAFVRNVGMTYPSIEDPSGTQILGFKAGLSPKAMPSVAFIDEEGRVAAVVLGEITRTTLYDVIEDIRA